jgi:hypothetical protein
MAESERARETVDWMLGDQVPLSEIEAFIECQPVGEEEKAALWLWAWAEKSLDRR